MRKLFLLPFLFLAAIPTYGQTSANGRIMEGPLALRPAVCSPGDYYVSTDTAPVVEYKCSTGNNWAAEATGGGGGGNSAGTNGTVQCGDGAGNFIACHLNDNVTFPGALFVNENLIVTGTGTGTIPTLNSTTITANTSITSFGSIFSLGPNPWIETSLYGMRAVASQFQTTATCTSGLSTCNLSSASNFQNGDGIVIYGAGATNTLSTPGAPTITPSLQSGPDHNTDAVNAPAGGATAYSYKIVARDKNGGLTAASPAGSTATGVATLGTLQSTVTNLARANNTVTVTTSAANGAAVGGIVFMAGSTDATFSGFFVIASVIDTTHFTYTQGIDTRAGGTASATGGTAQVYNCNHLTWAAVTGAWQYYIYGRTSGSWNLIGVSRPTELQWSDYGSTMSAAPTLPDFVPSSAPAVATNDYLATTITGGGGSTNITLAPTTACPTVCNNTSATTAKFDNGPNLLAAYTAAIGLSPSTVHITSPSSGLGYFINSHTILENTSAKILQDACITSNETIEINGLDWSGVLGGSCSTVPQFSFGPEQKFTVNAAYPAFYVASPSNLDHIAWSVPPQGLAVVLNDSIGYSFNSTITYSTCGISGTDYTGQCVVGQGVSNIFFSYSLFSTNNSSSFGYSLVPTILLKNDFLNSQGAGMFSCWSCYFTGRGIGIDSNPVSGSGSIYDVYDTYEQAMRSPLVEIGTSNNPHVTIRRSQNDSSTIGALANWGANGMIAQITDTLDTSTEVGGRPGLVTGNLIPGLQLDNDGANLGQTRDSFFTLHNNSISIPVYSSTPTTNTPIKSADYFMAAPLHFPSEHTLFWDLPTPTGVTAVVSAGGSVPAGGQTYEVEAVGADNGATSPSLPSTNCATSSGNQTCTVTWPAVTGAVAYNVYRGFQGVVACSHILVLTCVDTSATAGGGVSSGAVNATGTGSTTIMNNQVITPQITLVGTQSPVATTCTITQAASTCPGGGGGSGNVNAPANFTEGQNIVAANAAVNVQSSSAQYDFVPFFTTDWGTTVQTMLAGLPTANTKSYVTLAGTLTGSAHNSNVNPFVNLTGDASIFAQLPCYFLNLNGATSQWLINANDVVLNGCGVGGNSILTANGSFPTSTPMLFFGSSSLRNGVRLENYRINCGTVTGCTPLVAENQQEFSGLDHVNFVGGNSAGATAAAVEFEDPNGGGHYLVNDIQIGQAGANDFFYAHSQGASGALINRMTCNNTGFNTGLACFYEDSIDGNPTFNFFNSIHGEGLTYVAEFANHAGGSADHIDGTGTCTDLLHLDSGAITVTSEFLSSSSCTNLVNDLSQTPNVVLARTTYPNGIGFYTNGADFAKSYQAAAITDTGLTAGQSVCTSTNGLLTTSGCPSIFLANRVVSGTTATDTILAGDCFNRVTYQTSVNVAVTLPTPTTLGVAGCALRLVNATTGASTAVTVTPATLTIGPGATSSWVIQKGQFSTLTVDGTNWDTDNTFASTTNCASSASPAVCGAAAYGSVAIPTGAGSSTLTINTTAVTANSVIVFYPDDTLGTKLGVTCNSTLATLVGGSAVTARTAGTSFQITFNGTIATNPVCGNYEIVN